jgi:hypothetical protein
MMRGITNDKFPVLLEIRIKNKEGFGIFKLDNLNYALFP